MTIRKSLMGKIACLAFTAAGFLAAAALASSDNTSSRLSTSQMCLIHGTGKGHASVESVNCDQFNAPNGILCDGQGCPGGGATPFCYCCELNPLDKGDSGTGGTVEKKGWNYAKGLASCGKAKRGECNPNSKKCENIMLTGANCKNLEDWIQETEPGGP